MRVRVAFLKAAALGLLGNREAADLAVVVEARLAGAFGASDRAGLAIVGRQHVAVRVGCILHRVSAIAGKLGDGVGGAQRDAIDEGIWPPCRVICAVPPLTTRVVGWFASPE